MTEHYANLLGHPIPLEMMERLNTLVDYVNIVAKLRSTSLTTIVNTIIASFDNPSVLDSKPVIRKASAAVFGTCPEEAYLHVELIYGDLTCTPIMISCPLPCSKAAFGANKDFVSQLPTEQQIAISAFFKNVAQSLKFKDGNLSIEDSQATEA